MPRFHAEASHIAGAGIGLGGSGHGRSHRLRSEGAAGGRHRSTGGLAEGVGHRRHLLPGQLQITAAEVAVGRHIAVEAAAPRLGQGAQLQVSMNRAPAAGRNAPAPGR